jgi:deoxycytidylate deaminase
MNDIDWSVIKIFIAAPREMSAKRFTEIVKHYLPKGNIAIGISDEEYVVGFENQPQFRMLKQDVIQLVIDKVAASDSPNKVYPFVYSQRNLEKIVANLNDSHRVLLVNGSWKYTFHNHPAYKILFDRHVPIKFISPFVDEDEAKQFEASHSITVDLPNPGQLLTADEMFASAERASLQSYDYSFQTGASLGKQNGEKYEFIASTYNNVIPYQTYALHHGNSREKHLSQPHDTNHYDTVHAEMAFLIAAANGDYSLDGATLFINLLPCPNCARTLSQTTIDGIVYRNDHSDGYGAEILRLCGKKVRQRLKAQEHTLY